MLPNKNALLFLGILGGLLLGTSFLFYKKGEHIIVGNTELFFHTKLWPQEIESSCGTEDIPSIADGNHSINPKSQPKTTSIEGKTLTTPKFQAFENRLLPDSLATRFDSLTKSLKYLTLAPSSDQLESFFTRLSQAAKRSIRIWYYGDSQIEGDRITSEFRKEFQSRFGGSGMGFIPISNPASYSTLELDQQADWQKLNCFQHRKKTPDFGPSGLVYIPKDKNPKKWQTIGLNILKSTKYKQLYLELALDSNLEVQWKTKKDSAWHVCNKALDFAPFRMVSIGDSALLGRVSIRLRGANLKVYGLYFEGSGKGVYVDNFGIRGHSGDGLRIIESNKIASASLNQQTGLVIFHYGNNMVPYLKSDARSEKWVKDIFRGIFRKYRNSCKNVSFLVIGPGDMGYQKGEETVCYPSCNYLNQWMKQVSLEEGMSYFDFYQMIQDKGGILKWREQHIASLDGHLGPSGQRIFAKELSKELWNAYQAFNLTTLN